MRTKSKSTDPKEQSQREYKERTVAVYHFELPKRTALMAAALKGRLKMIKFLLLFQKKENIFLKDDNGDTVLDYSILGGNIEIIKLLLSKGLNVNGTEDGRWSPLMSAVNDAYSGKSFLNGKDEVIQFLLNNKASINYQSESGETALMLAVDSETDLLPDLEIIKLLIKNGADINLKDSEGYTALDKAVYLEFQTVIDYLVANGAKGKK
ncbi:MAG TPA: ankyrin repeat domain-containing protein [Spirochaetota bacterium]|nr:ankyrin repeat domain-containing protein [Spirochaetota bacterium]